jgi:hypothetical protein
MLYWLEIEKNFRLITGSAAPNTSVVAGKKLKKTDAYKSLADYINLNHKSNWTEKHAKGRYESYLKQYKVMIIIISILNIYIGNQKIFP